MASRAPWFGQWGGPQGEAWRFFKLHQNMWSLKSCFIWFSAQGGEATASARMIRRGRRDEPRARSPSAPPCPLSSKLQHCVVFASPLLFPLTFSAQAAHPHASHAASTSCGGGGRWDVQGWCTFCWGGCLVASQTIRFYWFFLPPSQAAPCSSCPLPVCLPFQLVPRSAGPGRMPACLLCHARIQSGTQGGCASRF